MSDVDDDIIDREASPAELARVATITMPNGLSRKIATHTAGMVPPLKIPPKRS
jgi:hypothetical protein